MAARAVGAEGPLPFLEGLPAGLARAGSSPSAPRWEELQGHLSSAPRT